MVIAKKSARKHVRTYAQGRHHSTNTGVSLVKLNRHTGHSDYRPKHSEFTVCTDHGGKYVIGICCSSDILKRFYGKWES